MGLLGAIQNTSNEIWRALRARAMPPRVRRDLMCLAVARRVTRPAEWTVHLPSGDVYLYARSFHQDTEVLYEVLGNEVYKTRYENAVVVDVGAHRGYYAVYALSGGARTVYSYEPEAHNYASLARARDEVRRRPEQVWQIQRAAVSSAPGRATLYVRESWSHSFYRPAPETQEVSVLAMTDILASARAEARAAGGALVVKLDPEGAECPIVLDTPASAWADVNELFIDTHPPASCSRSALIAQLRRAGLSYCEARAEYGEYVVLVFRRLRGSGDPGTAPPA